MATKASFYAVYGVELARADWLYVSDGLEMHRLVNGDDVRMFIAEGGADDGPVLVGVAYEGLPPGTCKPIREFDTSPEWDEVLRRTVRYLKCRAVGEPGWLLVHDVS
ncbi:hypothetical protein ACIOG4_27630 [Streptomyces microflavus]|uniref:hypothetical protein n=1 Tax=Streptomyces microflavus TaxID=1919 RepID=UPI0038047422